MDLLKQNTFKVVGRLVSQDLKILNKKTDGSAFISGNVIVEANLDGAKNEFEISFYANEKTQDGKISALYTQYSKLGELVGKKIEVTGDIRESRFWSTNANQMVSAQKLSGRFVHGVAETTNDEGTWEIGGFVVEGLKERLTKDNEVYRYDLTLGQANYRGDSMSRFVLHINPADAEIIAGVAKYNVGQTVQVNGDLRFIVTETRSERKNEGGFGEPVVRVYTNRQRNFFITGGSAPITDPEKGMYASDVIRSLVAAYKAADVQLAEKGKNGGAAQEEEVVTRVSNKQASLI
jgi:hypothetical protein